MSKSESESENFIIKSLQNKLLLIHYNLCLPAMLQQGEDKFVVWTKLHRQEGAVPFACCYA